MAKIRIRNGFADRNNIEKIDDTIQIDSLSSFTRIAIKNTVIDLFERWEKAWNDYFGFRNHVVKLLANDVFCIDLNSKDAKYDALISLMYHAIDNEDYYQVLSLLEYLASVISIYEYGYQNFNYGRFKVNISNVFNELFEKENIGYRFIEGRIEKITNKVEIDEIVSASNTIYNEKVNEHIRKALNFLSETGDRDYKNSIKESISALEGSAAIVSGCKNKTLSENIKEIGKKYELHPCLVEAVIKIYGYSSDESGIRHENEKEGHPVSFDEAKLILVLCSSCINYLMCLKCEK